MPTQSNQIPLTMGIINSIKSKIPNIAPIRPINRNIQARKILAPRTTPLRTIEVLEQEDETNQRTEQRCYADEPPCPPDSASVLEETERLLDEALQACIPVVWVCDAAVRYILTRPPRGGSR